MKILINYYNKPQKLNTYKLKKIGNGFESDVYQYKDLAIKLYKKKPKKVTLTENDVTNLKHINTRRILLPLDNVYKVHDFSQNEFDGYTTKLIKNIKDVRSLIEIDSKHLYNEIDILENDTKKLSNNKVRICDLWNNENFVFNNNLYFVDPGSFYFSEDLPTYTIQDLNIEELSMALFKYLFCLNSNLDYIKLDLDNIVEINKFSVNLKSILPIIRKIYEEDYNKNFLNSDKKFYLEYLKYILNKYETLKNYKLKILKEYTMDSNSDQTYVNYLKKIIK